MEPLCPECKAPLTSEDGKTARCPAHGGTFRIVYCRSPMPRPVAPVPGQVMPGSGAPAAVAAVSGGTVCRQHPGVAAAYACRRCNAPVCATCAFLFPSGVVLCPKCAVTPDPKVSSGRRKMLIWAYVLGSVATLSILLLFASASASSNGAGPAAALFSVLTFLSSLIGTAISVAAFDRRLSNPPAVWGAMIWNGVVFGIILLLCIIGMFM